MSSETMHGERRLVARKLSSGDRVLRSVEDKEVPPFVVLRVMLDTATTGYTLVKATSTDGRVFLFWPTDALMLGEPQSSHAVGPAFPEARHG